MITMKFSIKLILLFALIGFCSCSTPASRLIAEDLTKTQRIVDAAIHPLIAEHNIPGMAVAITINGEARFFNYGVASRESGAPVNEETLFEVGSVSKIFAGMLAAYAQELGKLSLNDHPGRYMPQLKGTAIDNASLLHLGTYTAGGLPLQFPAEVTDNPQMVRYFQQWQPDASPGMQRRYSNPSIGLLGYLVGMAFEDNFTHSIEAQLLPALGLNHTYIRVPENAMTHYAWGYNAKNEPIRVNPGVFDAEAYGIKSTSADLIRLLQANIDPNNLNHPMRRAIATTQMGYFEVGAMVQGLGWEQYPYPVSLEQLLAGNSAAIIMEPNPATQLIPARLPSGPTLFNKTGSTNGFGAYVAVVPERNIGIVMLANRNFPIPARIQAAYKILEQLAQ
jgi:beta-lactamase class C